MRPEGSKRRLEQRQLGVHDGLVASASERRQCRARRRSSGGDRCRRGDRRGGGRRRCGSGGDGRDRRGSCRRRRGCGGRRRCGCSRCRSRSLSLRSGGSSGGRRRDRGCRRDRRRGRGSWDPPGHDRVEANDRRRISRCDRSRIDESRQVRQCRRSRGSTHPFCECQGDRSVGRVGFGQLASHLDIVR